MPNILLVEDHDLMRDIMSRWLVSKGYEVTMAVDGEKAISKAHVRLQTNGTGVAIF